MPSCHSIYHHGVVEGWKQGMLKWPLLHLMSNEAGLLENKGLHGGAVSGVCNRIGTDQPPNVSIPSTNSHGTWILITCSYCRVALHIHDYHLYAQFCFHLTSLPTVENCGEIIRQVWIDKYVKMAT